MLLCLERSRKDSCAWEPVPPLWSVPRPTQGTGTACWAGHFCSLGSARPTCLSRVSPASTSSLWDCGLASVWRPSLRLSGLVRCGPPWGSHAPHSGEDGRGRPDTALAGAGGKWLGGETGKPAHCYSEPASEACPGCRVCIICSKSHS